MVWISRERAAQGLRPDGKLYAAPEIVAEVLSPGSTNERRDREVKLKLYAREGVEEYWLVDWRTRRVEVYRWADDRLHLVATLTDACTVMGCKARRCSRYSSCVNSCTTIVLNAISPSFVDASCP